MVPNERCANSSFNQPQLVVCGCYHGSSWEMGQLKFQSSTTGCLWMLPWFLMRDGPTQVSINHNWLFMDVTMVPHERWGQLKFQSTTTGCLWMLPWFLMRDWTTTSSFNQPQLVVFGCCHGSLWEMCQLKFQSSTTGLWMLPWFLMRDGPTQVSILHNWLFMDVTMVPHERWANSSFNQPQLVVYGCYHGSSWEMGQLKFQSTTTGCLWMLPWFLMRDWTTNSSFNQPQLVVFGCCHGSLWEMCQLKFQSSTTGLWMLPWFLMRDGPTQVSILHNWFMDVTMVPHERWANSSFNPPQLVVYGCYHGSSWEMGQLKFQSTTTSCLWMLPWFQMRDVPTQVSINHN